MKKIIGASSTEVKLFNKEPKEICRLGQQEKCCAFLVLSLGGFECVRKSYPANGVIFSRLDAGTMNAKGRGGWEGCAWEGEI